MSTKATPVGGIDYFAGERIVDAFAVSFHGGKATLNCTVIERWDEEIRGILRCGNEHTYDVTNRYGVSVVEREELESTISGSLGIKGIAEFKSEIKGKVGRELKFEEGWEVKRGFKVGSPECARLSMLVYKFKRLFKFSFRDDRFWHKDSWDKTITEWSNHIYDMSEKNIYDPNCGCEPTPKREPGGKINLLLNKMTMLLDYIHTDTGVEIANLNLAFPIENIQDLMFIDFTFDKAVIPDYLLFLAGETDNKLTGQFRPYLKDTDTYAMINEQGRKSEDILTEAPFNIPEGFTFFLIGAGIGVGLALLLAPKSGRELRDDIADYTNLGRNIAARTGGALGTRASDVYRAARERAAQGAGVVSDVADRQREQIAAAIEAGKQSYREEKKKQGVEAAVESE